MEFYTEPERRLPVSACADVIVAGAGPAGCAAAIAAARAGAKTILVEQFNCVGGMATGGMMSHFTGGTESPSSMKSRHGSGAKKPEYSVRIRARDLRRSTMKSLKKSFSTCSPKQA